MFAAVTCMASDEDVSWEVVEELVSFSEQVPRPEETGGDARRK